MNNQRRERLKEAIELVERATAVIEDVRNEEAETFENIPENLQGSERAESIQEAIYTLEAIQDDLDDKILELEEI